MRELTWTKLWDSVRVNLHYPVRIYGYVAAAFLAIQAFWQTELGSVPSWLMWANVGLAWLGTKLTERKTGSIRYLADNSDDSFEQDPDR